MQDRGWIDLHSHILPQLDDGSDSVEMSLAMLYQMAEQGVDVVCATSHYYVKYNSIPAFCERRAEALERLSSVLTAELPRVLPAAEVAYFPHMEEQDLMPLCILGTRTLMLEMPFSDWTGLQLETVEALVLDCRYDVVLVHPERFCFSKSNRPCSWKRWRPWCWIAAMMWCWCTPSGSASANPTGTNWKNWRNCLSGCRSTRAVCSVGAPGVWRWTCCRWRSIRCLAATATI